ncbi:MAG: septation ring formation regulator EzrA [Bacilli bacterium]|nr:septation ring formation regulator EzrA [Bacilli bacterium]
MQLVSMYVYIGGLVAVLILILVIYILINIKTKKSRLLKQINNLEKRKITISETPINAKLVKISMIGQSNVVFASLYQEYKIAYDNLNAEFIESLEDSIKKARELCINNDYKKCNEVIHAIDLRLNTFEEKINLLHQNVNDVLKDENDIKDQADRLKEKFMQCEQLFQNYKSEVNFNIDKYEYYFKDINDKFQILNDYTVKGNYLDANDLLKIISEGINSLYNNLLVAKNYVRRVLVDTPNKLNNIIDQYNEMQKAKYPLYNILANTTINNIKEDIHRLVDDLQSFNYENIETKIETLEAKVNKLENSLMQEKETRSYFEANMKEIYDRASNLETDYLHNLRKYSELGSVYCINKDVSETMKRIKFEVNELNTIRRNLDSLNYGMQPYSIRVKKLEELKKQADKVENSINEYLSLVKDMRQTSEASFELVNSSAATLKKLQLRIRNSHVNRLIMMYNDSFINGYMLIDKLEETIKVTPIDVNKANHYASRIEELLTDLKTNCERDLLLLKEAEKLLMFSSQYKASFVDFEKAHIKAEGYFYDCRYESSIETLVDALNRIEVRIPFNIKGVEKL